MSFPRPQGPSRSVRGTLSGVRLTFEEDGAEAFPRFTNSSVAGRCDASFAVAVAHAPCSGCGTRPRLPLFAGFARRSHGLGSWLGCGVADAVDPPPCRCVPRSRAAAPPAVPPSSLTRMQAVESFEVPEAFDLVAWVRVPPGRRVCGANRGVDRARALVCTRRAPVERRSSVDPCAAPRGAMTEGESARSRGRMWAWWLMSTGRLQSPRKNVGGSCGSCETPVPNGWPTLLFSIPGTQPARAR